MYSKHLLSVALFAIAAKADDHEMTDAEKYPDMAWAMSTLYPDYTWEAVEVDSGDWTKTLFHITGSTANPNWQPGRQSVLLMGGGGNQVTHWITTMSASYGTSKRDYAQAAEAEMLQNIKNYAEDMEAGVDNKVKTGLSKVKEAVPDRFETVAAYWKENDIVDLEEILSTWPDEEIDDCTSAYFDDLVQAYADSVADVGEASNYEDMGQPTVALPIALFNYGFDVWMDAARGTKYNSENSELSRSSAAYWDFTFRDYALEDLDATTNFILSTDRNIGTWDTMSYVGYSMGSRQMYYLMGMAPDNSAASDIVSRVDKFIALAPCPWSNAGEFNIETETQLGEALRRLNDASLNYFWGYDASNADIRSQANILCDSDWMVDRSLEGEARQASQDAADAYEEMCKRYMDEVADMEPGSIGALSKKDIMSDWVAQQASAVSKTFSYDAENGTWSTDWIDFSRAQGPDVYQFNGGLDTDCPTAAVADVIHAEMGDKSVRQFQYDCFNHLDFIDNSSKTEQLHKDIVVTLGAQTLAATAVAAVAALALF